MLQAIHHISRYTHTYINTFSIRTCLNKQFYKATCKSYVLCCMHANCFCCSEGALSRSSSITNTNGYSSRFTQTLLSIRTQQSNEICRDLIRLTTTLLQEARLRTQNQLQRPATLYPFGHNKFSTLKQLTGDNLLLTRPH